MWFILAFLALVALETYVVGLYIMSRPVSDRWVSMPDEDLYEVEDDDLQGAIECCCFY